MNTCNQCNKKPEDQIQFESFCKENDLEYNFDFMSGGKFYRSSETNKAFCIFKWAPKGNNPV